MVLLEKEEAEVKSLYQKHKKNRNLGHDCLILSQIWIVRAEGWNSLLHDRFFRVERPCRVSVN